MLAFLLRNKMNHFCMGPCIWQLLDIGQAMNRVWIKLGIDTYVRTRDTRSATYELKISVAAEACVMCATCVISAAHEAVSRLRGGKT